MGAVPAAARAAHPPRRGYEHSWALLGVWGGVQAASGEARGGRAAAASGSDAGDYVGGGGDGGGDGGDGDDGDGEGDGGAAEHPRAAKKTSSHF